MKRYDIAIIGTGPAGLSAAITAKIRNKTTLLIGKKALSSKIKKASLIQNYPGLPNVTGKKLQKAFLHHLDEMDIPITEDQVNTVYAMGTYFAIQGHHAQYEASSVILAAGLFTANPYPGELEHLGNGVSYCATCDAALYKGKSAIVISSAKDGEEEAEFLAQTAGKVSYLPLYKEKFAPEHNIELIHQTPTAIERHEDKMRLLTKEGFLEADGIFLLREQVAPSQLVPGLTMNGNHVETDKQLQTNMKGLFACGDITGTPYQYVKAAGEGNVAALSAVNYLAKAEQT